jgi:hypothetical protein
VYFDLGLLVGVVVVIFVFGMGTGALWSLKKYKRNRFFSVLPGQIWLLNGVGLVRVVHSSQPGSEVLYLYNIEKGEASIESGVCSRKELISNGILLVEDDPDIPNKDIRDEENQENIIKFPYSFDYDDEN